MPRKSSALRRVCVRVFSSLSSPLAFCVRRETIMRLCFPPFFFSVSTCSSCLPSRDYDLSTSPLRLAKEL